MRSFVGIVVFLSLVTVLNCQSLAFSDAEVLAELRDQYPALQAAPYNWIGDASTQACVEDNWQGIDCIEEGGFRRVATLEIHNVNLASTFPDLSALTKLSNLQLTSTGLIGRIPSWIGNSTELTIFYAYNNSLSSLPLTFDNPNLRDVDLSDNFITGSIPSDLLALPVLETLILQHNLLSGELPSLANFALLLLDVSYNNLSGFSDGVLPTLPSLITLNLSHNNISGPIPDFSGLSEVQRVFLSHNNFSQTFPKGLTDSQFLKLLDLSNNQISDNLERIGIFPVMEDLNLAHNNFYGKLPGLANMTRLKELFNFTHHHYHHYHHYHQSIRYLSFNNLSGVITQIVNPALEALDISNNNFTGDLPFVSLPNIKKLYIGHNNFSGDVSQRFENIASTLDVCTVVDNSPDLVCPANFTICCSNRTSQSTVGSSVTATLSSSSSSQAALSSTSSTLASTTSSTNAGCSDYTCVCSSNITVLTTSTACRDGTWMIEGNVENNGAIVVAQGDVIIVNGSFTQNPQAILTISTNGSAAGSIQVSGVAQLGGTLVIIITSHNTGSNTINIINAAEITGKFEKLQIDQQFRDSRCYNTKGIPNYGSTSMAVVMTTTKKGSCSNKGKTIGIAVGVTLGFVFLIVIAAVIAVILYQKHKGPGKITHKQSSPSLI